MGDLHADLKEYSHELYTKRDLKAGVTLLKEIVGAAGVAVFMFTVVTVWMPAIGFATTPLGAAMLLRLAAEGYAKLSTQERKELRAVVRWIQGGFSLGERLVK